MKKIYDKLTCALIGWDYNILTQCGEASHRTKNKYVSALIIVSIIWGIIGYRFASKYIGFGENIVANSCVSFAFIVIVNCIERIIIMKQGKNKPIYAFRAVLAICMACLGAFIFDQILFATDLERQIAQNKQEEIKQTVKLRNEERKADLARAEFIRDSLYEANHVLNEKLAKEPTIERSSLSSQQVLDHRDEQGNAVYRTLSSINRTQVENPLANQVRANEAELENNQKLIESIHKRTDNIENEVTQEIMNRKIGFMEELMVSEQVFFGEKITVFVYALLFIFMLGLELFVCSISWLEKDCDYDLIVEHQLYLKGLELKHSKGMVEEKYVMRQLDSK